MEGVYEYLNLYIKFIKKFADLRRPLKVAFDCSNGSTGFILKKLKIKNCQLKIINPKPDGYFPAHGPNPLVPGALKQLSQVVKKEKADLGAAFDADGDRVVFVDEKGQLIEPYLIAYLLFLNHQPPFVADIFNFEALKYLNWHKNVFPSKVGTRFIKELMKKKKAKVGAEYSGHYYFQESFNADDALLAAIKIMNIVSRLPYSLSQFKNLLPHKLKTTQINFKTTNPTSLLKIIKKRYAKKAKKILEIDGLTLEFKKGWFTVRPSNTEPLIRILIGQWIY